MTAPGQSGAADRTRPLRQGSDIRQQQMHVPKQLVVTHYFPLANPMQL